ncbi:MAG: hypothetical protein AAB726_02370 [Patescibacteria group bacterium]
MRNDEFPHGFVLFLVVLAALSMAGYVVNTRISLQRDRAGMTDEQRAQADALYKEASLMPIGSFVNLEEDLLEWDIYQVGGEWVVNTKTTNTYRVVHRGPMDAELSGPGPGSTEYLNPRPKSLWFRDISRGDKAPIKVKSIITPDEEGWRETNEWYAIQ